MIFFYSPLHYAAYNGHLNVVEYLVDQGADYRDGIRGESYFHWASSRGHLSVIESLVNQKADINEKDKIVEFMDLIGLLFIMLLIMVILVLLNFYFIKKLIRILKLKIFSFCNWSDSSSFSYVKWSS